MSCKFCKEKQSIKQGRFIMTILKAELGLECFTGSEDDGHIDDEWIDINYCPMCGKKLKEVKELSKDEDLVNSPSHYNTGKYEVIDVIDDWGLDFSLGNAIKYIARAEHKGNFKQDIEKAIWYLKREIERNEGK